MSTDQDCEDEPRKSSHWLNLLFSHCLLMPAVFLLTMLGGTMIGHVFWFWMILVLCIEMMGSMIAETGEQARSRHPLEQLRMLAPEQHPTIVRRVMDVRLATEKAGLVLFADRC